MSAPVPSLPLGTPVPPLTIATPRTAAERMALYTPRKGEALYSPRTHREQLDNTGAELAEALETAAELAEAVARLSARANQHRAAFIAKAQANVHANQREQCPICMESLVQPMACANRHKFCNHCLASYRRCSLSSPRLLCPLCRVPMPEPHLGGFARSVESLHRAVGQQAATRAGAATNSDAEADDDGGGAERGAGDADAMVDVGGAGGEDAGAGMVPSAGAP